MNRSSVLMDAADLIERVAMSDRLEEQPTLRSALASGQTRIALSGGIRSLTTSQVGGELAVGQPRLVVPQMRRLFLRDLVPVIPVSTYMQPFVRELNPQASEMGASGAPELSVKPDVGSGFTFQPVPVVPGTLAANCTVTQQLWDDSPSFAAYVDVRLPYEVRLREEFAAFQGNGEDANGGITGILHDAALSASAIGGGLIFAAAQLCAIVAGTGAMPDAVFCNATDWYRQLSAMAGSVEGPFPGVVDLLPPMAPSLSVPSGTVIAGDFANGAVLIERDEVNVDVYPQHADYRAKNLVLVQAEERVGFHVVAPWRFAYVTGLGL